MTLFTWNCSRNGRAIAGHARVSGVPALQGPGRGGEEVAAVAEGPTLRHRGVMITLFYWV